MKNIKILSELRTEFNSNFKTGRVDYRSFHDLLWQIKINKMTGKEVVVFHVNVTAAGNEIVIAFKSGGFQPTGVLFVDGNYNSCCDIIEKINEKFFSKTKNQQMEIISKSMHLATL